jgi:uncharacterized 2Fe-2S/4Fe-4S cluster protein (DUF4445 family)
LSIDGKDRDVAPGSTIFDVADELGVRVPTSCRKNGKCRECLVEIELGDDLLSERVPEEEHLQGRFRLACRARVVASSGMVRCHTLRRGEMRISEAGKGLPSSENARLDPAVTRDGDWVLLDDEPLVRAEGALHGVAVDLGTTTIVLRLVDLESGRVVATRSFENPQRFGGSDVMARIQYDTDHKGRLLQRTLLGYLSHAIEDLPCDPATIYEMLVVGNTTMRDLFFGLPVYTIGQMPYRSIVEKEMDDGDRDTTAIETMAERLRLPVFPHARVVSLPLVRGHVGADTTACLLAIGFERGEGTVALMDIGTNTEIIVGHRDRALSASCPAGPAFEGGSIACGMPGLEGAIESVSVDEDGSVSMTVIGGGGPVGICGSGLVETLGELRRTERMSELGRFVDESERFVVDQDAGVYVSEADISELAQAKGANVAGLSIVLDRYGVEFSDLDRFYLAGGFAEHLDLDAARRIGFVPDLPDGRVEQIGNAAIEGATIALRSRSARVEIERIVQRIQHVELEVEESFFDFFVEGCQFHPFGTSGEKSRGDS